VTPTEIVATLNARLLEWGETVTLRRYTAPTGNPRPKTEVAARGIVRVRTTPTLVGEVSQVETHVTLSPTEATVASWPLPVRTGDKIVIQSIERNIDEVHPILVADTLVRINLVVRG
jgi:hypothetical protein